LQSGIAVFTNDPLRSVKTSLGLLGASGGASELSESSEGDLLVVVANESLFVDDLGGVVNITANVLADGGGVGGADTAVHNIGLSDAVLLCVLQSHGESSLSSLGASLSADVDSHGVGILRSVHSSVSGEGRVSPVLSHEFGLVAGEAFGNAPNKFW